MCGMYMNNSYIEYFIIYKLYKSHLKLNLKKKNINLR